MTPKRSQTMLWVSKVHSEASEALYCNSGHFFENRFWGLTIGFFSFVDDLDVKNGFSKAERNQFSDFNMYYHVKPRQFQAHMDQF